MSKYGSFMTDQPEKRTVYASISYCFFSLVLIPAILGFVGLGFDLKRSHLLWIEIIYHVLNCLVAVALFFGHMKDTLYCVSLDPKRFWKITLIGAACMLAVRALFYISGGRLLGNSVSIMGVLPPTESDLFFLSGALVMEKPILGTVCVVLLAPLATSLLYYATCFAPICNDRPWLAYIVTAIFLAIPRAVHALTFWSPSEELSLYLVQLPIHLIACRVYQKADTVWAPIFAHMIANLIICAVFILALI